MEQFSFIQFKGESLQKKHEKYLLSEKLILLKLTKHLSLHHNPFYNICVVVFITGHMGAVINREGNARANITFSEACAFLTSCSGSSRLLTSGFREKTIAES